MKNRTIVCFLLVLTVLTGLAFGAGQILARNFDTNVVFYKNKYVFKIEGQPVKMPVKVIVEETDIPLIPLRFLASSLRYNVEWDANTSTARFSSKWGSFSIKVQNKDDIYITSTYQNNPHDIILNRNRLYADPATICDLMDIVSIEYPENNTVAFSVSRERIKLPAPNFTLKDTKGQNFNLYDQFSDGETEYIILNFYATRCPFCLKALPMIVDLSEEYKDKGVKVVGVNTDTAGQEKDRDEKLEKYNVQYTVVQDINNITYDKYAVSGVPNFFVVDKNLDIVYHSIVADEEQIVLLKEWLNQYLQN